MNFGPKSTRRGLASRLGLGRLGYLFWHWPKEIWDRSVREGGPINQWRDARGRAQMTRAAASLSTQRMASEPSLPELHFLTGKKFWDQTAFCLHSLQRHSGCTFRAVFHDDGSFDEPMIAQLGALFPLAEIRRRAENDRRLAALLPIEKFPYLHDRRQHYPNILKLTDVHAGAKGWRLVLDSDMLFFRRPDFLLNWLAQPDRPLHMLDVANAYGYPEPDLARLAGGAIPPVVNVGLTGLRSDTIDWEQLERWCRDLIERHGTSYYLEQALIAMMLVGKPCAIAPRDDYILMPALAECRSPRAVMHHYVAESKRGYFRYAWRHVLP